MSTLSRMDVSLLRRRLLSWFDKNARDLPWRADRDPYRIWISEVMLQQTTVAAVVPYFHRFLARFPTLADLATAEQADVLRLWEGLGYYSRARNLHRAAQLIHANHAGKMSRDADAVHALPGFGRYTTGAVLSQAFDLKLPILEANSVRLLCRLYAIADDPKAPATQKRLWELAEELLPNKRVGDFNQALMELGALVCSPSGPRCDACPLTSVCHAYRDKRTAEIPRAAERRAPTEVAEIAVVLRKANRVLLVQRPSTGRWADMWEFPRAEIERGQSRESAAEKLIHGLGFQATLGRQLAVVRHSVTRFRITLACVEAHVQSGRFHAKVYPRSEWLAPDELAEYPVSRPQRTLTNLVRGVT